MSNRVFVIIGSTETYTVQSWLDKGYIIQSMCHFPGDGSYSGNRIAVYLTK